MKYTIIILTTLACSGAITAGPIVVPNHSFESPLAPRESPYALPVVDVWQKSAQPAWYDPSQNANTPWDFLMGTFFNVPFPGLFIDNCDGSQAAFLFALPEAALFQDGTSAGGTNGGPGLALEATFQAGHSYELTVAALGGGGGMKPGVTLQISFYYRDPSSNKVTVAATSITNSLDLFPTNTHFIDFQARVPTVQTNDPWAGQPIGIELLSTTSFELAGGYWNLDNVRLVETASSLLALSAPFLTTNGQITFSIHSQPGLRFEIQATTNLLSGATNWTSLGSFTNGTGVVDFTDSATNLPQRFYRARPY